MWHFGIGKQACLILELAGLDVPADAVPFVRALIPQANASATEVVRSALHRMLGAKVLVQVLEFAGLRTPELLVDESFATRLRCREYSNAVSAANQADTRGLQREATEDPLFDVWQAVEFEHGERATEEVRMLVLSEVLGFTGATSLFVGSEDFPVSPQTGALMQFHHLLHGRPKSSTMTTLPSD
jgi:hypothetical protein